MTVREQSDKYVVRIKKKKKRKKRKKDMTYSTKNRTLATSCYNMLYGSLHKQEEAPKNI